MLGTFQTPLSASVYSYFTQREHENGLVTCNALLPSSTSSGTRANPLQYHKEASLLGCVRDLESGSPTA